MEHGKLVDTKQFEIDHSTVSRVVKAFKETQTAQRQRRADSGRKAKTTDSVKAIYSGRGQKVKFSAWFIEQAMKWTGLRVFKIEKADSLPQRVCLDCVELTIDAFRYINRVRDADQLLKNSLLIKNNTPTTSDTVITEYVVDLAATSKSEPDNDEQREYIHSEVREQVSYPDAVAIEYLDSLSETTSSKLIDLLIESVHDEGSEKWLKIKLDPDGAQVLQHSENDTSTDEEETSFTYVEPHHVDLKTELNISEGKVVRCCIRKCQLRFRSREELLRHGAETHAGNKSIVNSAQLFEYRLDDQPIKICCGCEATFKTVEELFQHGVDMHQNQYSYASDGRENQCNICYQYFKSNTTLRNHQILVYKPRAFFCPECNKGFECPSKLSNHQATHTTERNFACETCGSKFKTPADLRGHQRMHQEKALICSVCGLRFYKKSHLKSHLKTHDDQAYEFACSICSKQFKEKSNWKNHLKVHTKETPFRCQYCNKNFRYTSDRKRHEISHTGIYPHKCSICNKPFIRKNQLRQHERTCSTAPRTE
ncbi:zinc finger protein 287-like [Sabethes cyaneus]|uniref:zinc finger protein 287-like n=1 Tax=Sabethes cyaneus TaxID=53552 RepID=UPI00237D58E6|nr:zinc finger protein 287-like [Sabethes cyaneus]